MTSHASRISKLASIVATNTQRIDAYFIENALPQPSFDECGPTTFQLPPELEKCRQELLASSQELQELMRTPSELLQSRQVCITILTGLCMRGSVLCSLANQVSLG